MPDTTAAVAPIALAPDAGEALWFLGSLVTVKAGVESTRGGVTVMENLAPRGMGSPLHVHRREDEWFYVLDGALTFWVGGDVVEAPAGAFVYGPRDVPHTFVVRSEQARFLLVTEPAGFERFVGAVAQPAESRTIPPAPAEPPDLERLVAVAAQHGIEITGPPGLPG